METYRHENLEDFKYDIKSINSTIGIFYNKRKRTNDKWILLVYKNTTLLKQTIKGNRKLFQSIKNLLGAKMVSLKDEMMTKNNLIKKQFINNDKKI